MCSQNQTRWRCETVSLSPRGVIISWCHHYYYYFCYVSGHCCLSCSFCSLSVKQVQPQLWFLWRNYYKAKVKGQGQLQSGTEVPPGAEHGLTVLLKDTLAWISSKRLIFLYNCQAPLLLLSKNWKRREQTDWITHSSLKHVAHVTGTSTGRQRKRNRGRCWEAQENDNARCGDRRPNITII